MKPYFGATNDAGEWFDGADWRSKTGCCWLFAEAVAVVLSIHGS